jgi:hypothetical protein
MAEKLLMLRNSTLATAEPDAVLEYTIHVNYRHPSIPKQVAIIRASKARVGMAKDKNIAQVAQRNLFKGSFFPLLRAMEGVTSMTFYEAVLAPPMRPITILTPKPSFNLATCSASQGGWGKFLIQ